MRKLIASVMSALFIIGGTTVIAASPAEAAGKCMSRSEYRHIHHGQSQRKVRRILDGQRGKV